MRPAGDKMKVIEEFTLTDSFDLDEKTIKEYAMDAAKRRQELHGNFTIEGLKIELVETKIEKKYRVKVLGKQIDVR